MEQLKTPKKKVKLTNLQYKINFPIQKLHKKKKIEPTRRLTDLELPKSPIQSPHKPLEHSITILEPLIRAVRIIISD